MVSRSYRGKTIIQDAVLKAASLGGVPLSTDNVVSHLPVHNATGGTLTKGTLVYLNGWSGSAALFTVAKADADGGAGVDRATLLITANILNGADGYASAVLELTGLNTNAGNVGDPVYLSTTAGGWTLTAPTAAGARQQVVGFISVKNATTGKIQFNLAATGAGIIGSSDLEAGSVTEAKLDPAVSLGLNALRVCHSVYDFATDGGAQGTLALRGGTLPDKAVILGGVLDVGTAILGTGASVALQANAANDIVNSAAISGAPWSTTGLKAIIPVFTAATMKKTTAARIPSMVITTADLTAGHFNLDLLYVVSDVA